MVTVSMIVKNEEKRLRECLESVKDAAGEIIIVDTGSDDGTLEIAKEYNAVIHNFRWVNDFSAARNFALEKSKGEWILYLDADERLSGSSIQELKKLTNKNSAVPGKRAYQCAVKNLDDFNGRPSTMLYTRLFPNNPRVRFEGAIHEQIENSLINNGYKIIRSGIEIIHTGYSTGKDQLKRKAERNLEILLKEYTKRKTSYNAFHIAQSYALIENKIKALEFFNACLKDFNLKKEYRALAFRYIAVDFAERQDWKKAVEYISESLKNDPEQPLALLVASKIFAKTGNFAEAERCCRRAYDVNSSLSSGSKHSYQAIYMDEKDILYHCMAIAFSLPGREAFALFYDKYRDRQKKENESEIELVDALVNNKHIDENHSGNLFKCISANNLELIISLLDNYGDDIFKLDLLNYINLKFPGSSFILNKLALLLVSRKRFNEAEGFLLNSYEANRGDPSTIFYLASVFIQNNKPEKIVPLIRQAEQTFGKIPEVSARLQILKQKLNIK